MDDALLKAHLGQILRIERGQATPVERRALVEALCQAVQAATAPPHRTVPPLVPGPYTPPQAWADSTITGQPRSPDIQT
jgi:hypothetical protein